jgi:sec-independent protein translocase protein TatA
MGAMEIIVIFVIYLLFFGSKGIPSLARNLGRAVHQFRSATQDIQREIMNSANDIKKEADTTTNEEKSSSKSE